MDRPPASRGGRRILAALGLLAGIGLVFIARAGRDEGSQIAAALTAVPVFVLLCIVFLGLVFWGLRKTRFGGIATASLALGGLAAAAGGAWLLVALACKMGGVR